MESDVEDTKSQMTQNPSTPQTRKQKKKKKIPTVQATIQVVPDIPEKTPPLVGYFPCSFDPTKSPYSNSTDVGLFRDSKKPRRLQIVVTPNGTNVDFVGTNYTGEATTGQSCNFALGVLDKATQTLKILPVASNKGEDIHGITGLVNLFGIESPGLTSRMGVAEHIATRFFN